MENNCPSLTSFEVEASTFSLELTDSAASHISRFLKRRQKGIGVKIGVKTTGCSGLAYKLEYADTFDPNENFVIKISDFYVIVDKKSAPYLTGMTVDYVRQGLNEGFEFNNPNEKDRCGCGESFRV